MRIISCCLIKQLDSFKHALLPCRHFPPNFYFEQVGFLHQTGHPAPGNQDNSKEPEALPRCILSHSEDCWVYWLEANLFLAAMKSLLPQQADCALQPVKAVLCMS